MGAVPEPLGAVAGGVVADLAVPQALGVVTGMVCGLVGTVPQVQGRKSNAGKAWKQELND